MKKLTNKWILLTAITCTIAFAPNGSVAQEKKNDNAAEKSAGAQGDANKAANPNRAIPFRGKVDAVDKSAKTVKVGTRVFQVTAETKIQKEGKALSLDDVVVGEPIRGSYRQAEDGKLNAQSLFFGVKETEGSAEGEKQAPAKSPPKGAKNAAEKTAE